nr:hypothetical protein Iba_scaffold10073CG0240 [Ipomoea batatas]
MSHNQNKMQEKIVGLEVVEFVNELMGNHESVEPFEVGCQVSFNTVTQLIEYDKQQIDKGVNQEKFQQAEENDEVEQFRDGEESNKKSPEGIENHSRRYCRFKCFE